MKILKRILLDQLEDGSQSFAMNTDYLESDSTIVLNQNYDELVEALMGHASFLFFPEDILERDFNKRLIDAAYEAGIVRLLVIVSKEYDETEKDTLRQYIEDYHGFDYLFLEIPALMDELFIQMAQGKQLKKMPQHSLSSQDALDVLLYFFNAKELGEKAVTIEGVYYENTEKYYEAFVNPQEAEMMKMKKEDPFIEILGRKPETWDHFVQRKKAS